MHGPANCELQEAEHGVLAFRSVLAAVRQLRPMQRLRAPREPQGPRGPCRRLHMVNVSSPLQRCAALRGPLGLAATAAARRPAAANRRRAVVRRWRQMLPRPRPFLPLPPLLRSRVGW